MYCVISKYKGLWKVNSTRYIKDNSKPLKATEEVNYLYSLSDIQKNFVRSSVKKNKKDIFISLKRAQEECENRNRIILNSKEQNRVDTSFPYDYVHNNDGSQDVYYMDENGEESYIKVW